MSPKSKHRRREQWPDDSDWSDATPTRPTFSNIPHPSASATPQNVPPRGPISKPRNTKASQPPFDVTLRTTKKDQIPTQRKAQLAERSSYRKAEPFRGGLNEVGTLTSSVQKWHFVLQWIRNLLIIMGVALLLYCSYNLYKRRDMSSGSASSRVLNMLDYDQSRALVPYSQHMDQVEAHLNHWQDELPDVLAQIRNLTWQANGARQNLNQLSHHQRRLFKDGITSSRKQGNCLHVIVDISDIVMVADLAVSDRASLAASLDVLLEPISKAMHRETVGASKQEREQFNIQTRFQHLFAAHEAIERAKEELKKPEPYTAFAADLRGVQSELNHGCCSHVPLQSDWQKVRSEEQERNSNCIDRVTGRLEQAVIDLYTSSPGMDSV